MYRADMPPTAFVASAVLSMVKTGEHERDSLVCSHLLLLLLSP
jgi:hypothetical protein